jgi:hypothetical protein
VWVALAIAYFAVVAIGVTGDGLRASADAVADGQLWLLVTSGLKADPPYALAQVAIAAALAALFITARDARTWWIVVLAGHVLSAVVAYVLIGVAIALGSDGARSVAGESDYGVSCVLGATVGGLLVLGLQRRDPLRTAVGAIGALVMVAVSVGWYDAEHVLSAAIGAATTWLLTRSVHRLARSRG